MLDQLVIHKLIFFFILNTHLVDIVRRNSVLVTHGSERVCKLYVRVTSNPGLDLICITLLCDWKRKRNK